MFEYFGDFSYDWTVVRECRQSFAFVLFITMVLVVVCNVFVGLVDVEVFVESCCFVRLVFLMSILFVFCFELVGGSAFW